MTWNHRSAATRMGVSISIAVGVYGVSFGALAVSAGFSIWQTMAFSLLMFTGGSQFAFIGVIAGGGSGAAAVSAASLLGIRNAVYGVQVNRLLQLSGWQRWLGAQITIDESAATALAQDTKPEQARGFWVAGIGVFVLWNLFTLMGALLGDVLGDPKRWGLDGAAVAAFMGLLWPRLKEGEAVAVAILCALGTLCVLPWLPAGVPILVAAAIAMLWGWLAPMSKVTS